MQHLVFVPLSGSVSVNFDESWLTSIEIQVFVPLSGSVSVNGSAVLTLMEYDNYSVFVPLSGSVSVNEYDITGSIPTDSFRPLIGVSFCKPYTLQAIINKGLQGALACLKFNKRFQPKLS